MSERDLLSVARKRMRRYAGLPRRGICVRAVHHIFNPESDTEEADDGDPLPRVRRTQAESCA